MILLGFTGAGFLERTDHEIGRVVNALKDIGELKDTLIFYIVGDNGTSAEDGMIGMTENVFLNIKNESKRIRAEVEVPEGGGQGTIIAQGGRFGGRRTADSP